jgi:tetratricopeptide (TPR) repeat protein
MPTVPLDCQIQAHTQETNFSITQSAGPDSMLLDLDDPFPALAGSAQQLVWCQESSKSPGLEHDTIQSLSLLRILEIFQQHCPLDGDILHSPEEVEVTPHRNIRDVTCVTSRELLNCPDACHHSSVDVQNNITRDIGEQRLISGIQGAGPFKFHTIDIFFPSGNVMSDPYIELYPFPRSEPVSRISKLVEDTTWRSRQLKASQLETLINVLPENHSTRPDILQSLADTYQHMGKLELAERLYFKISAFWERTKERNPGQLLHSQLDLVNCISERGRDKEAAAMLGPVHSSIIAKFDPLDDLVAHSLGTMSAVLYNQYRYKEAEERRRQQLQIRLSKYGPRHPMSLATITSLGSCLAELGEISSGEQLLKISVQLGSETAEEFDADLAFATSRLMWLLRKQNKFHESTDLGQMAVKRSVATLGEEHPDTVQCSTELGVSFRFQGFLQKSRDFLARTLEKALEFLGDKNIITLWTMLELGFTLCSERRFQEATPWFERSFLGRLEVFGQGDKKTLTSCRWLGYCYEKQGQHEEALALYEKFTSNVQGADPDSQRLIDQIQHQVTDSLRRKVNRIRASKALKESINMPE